ETERDSVTKRQERYHAADQNEERIAGRVRNSQRVGRRDVLARVPEGGGGRQRQEVDEQDRERRDRGDPVGWAVARLPCMAVMAEGVSLPRETMRIGVASARAVP